MNQNQVGRIRERDAIEYLRTLGCWVHYCVPSPMGQPCDLIVVKGSRAYLVDVKNVESYTYFTFSRIEPNQEMAFKYARERHDLNCCFLIYFKRTNEWKVLEYEKYKAIKDSYEPNKIDKEVMTNADLYF